MNLLIITLTIIDVMVALLLIAVVLVQQSKDGGFGGSAFGGAGEAVFGGQVGDHLSKLTVVLATMFFVITLSLAIVTGRRTGGEVSVVEDDAAVSEMTAVGDDKKKVDEKNPETTIKAIVGDKKTEVEKTVKPPVTSEKPKKKPIIKPTAKPEAPKKPVAK